MNRDFLSNFEKEDDRTVKSNAVNDSTEESGNGEYVDGDYPLNVCFVWPDGKRRFAEYSRLSSGEINSDHEMIRLHFGSDTVELTGLALLPLFDSFMDHKRKFVYCDDARYNDLNDTESTVNEINIIHST
jgi:hypothetical protein